MLYALFPHFSLSIQSGTIVAPEPTYPLLLAEASEQSPLLVLTASTHYAQSLATYIRAFSEQDIVEFPAWETLPHERLSPKTDTVVQRLKVLHQIQGRAKDKPRIVVTNIRAFLAPINSQTLEINPLAISAGSELSIHELVANLAYFGFSRTDLVERRGDFAVRGGIVDIFPGDYEHPIRIDYFGDEVEEIHFFSVHDQRSMEIAPSSVEIFPVRELLIDEKVRKRAEYVGEEFPHYADLAEKIAQGIYVEGMESLAPLLTDNFQFLHTLLPSQYRIIAIDEPRIRSRAINLRQTNEEFLEASWAQAAMGSKAPVDLYRTGFQEWELLREKVAIEMNPYKQRDEERILEHLTELPEMGGTADEIASNLRHYVLRGYRTIVTANGEGTLDRYHDILVEQDLPVRKIHDISAELPAELTYLFSTSLSHGFIDEINKILICTERDLVGKAGEKEVDSRLPSRRKKTIDPLELHPGDYVVHEVHGIGRFIQLIERTTQGISREYLVVEYAPSRRGHPGDRLFIPTDTLDLLTKYVGGDAPALHKIGGSDWQNSKRRARKAVRKIAAELIQLYAARMSAPGYAFSPDTPWQRELEAAFPYVETADQLSTIEEVKRDMESPHPMDRIICGDVGYGKTEIAVRAAFKAVQDSKQVAVLVPTTLLVQQHLATFSSRYAGFPVRVAAFSRFNSEKESKQILKDLKSGGIDVVIGTHRLLSQDVEFRDLGLVIVDEEQRFGVEHKEELKKTRANIDVLSMSATPIPRTLEMAITGIREMSTITTPPEERHPVLTYVGAYDDKQVTAAIHRELLRDGQVFYVHNRVETIDRTVEHLRELVPDARIRVAHGQMRERELEDVIVAFWEKEFDVLVCTTIVENGIDIPNANTLIVDRADTFGLSQLHQLRGRVGRSRERAYAYFLYSAERALTEVAHDRLTTIATNSELGAGIQVALKDLEIRGAGNLLGGEQSGHIAEVCFDLYMRMVGEAVEDFKVGIAPSRVREIECRVEIPVTAFIPHEYIDSDRLRLDVYRRIADAKTEEDLQSIKEELIDRFGSIPLPVLALMDIAALRSRARAAGISEITWQGKFLKTTPLDLTEKQSAQLHHLYPGSIVKANLSTVLLATDPEQPVLEWINQAFDEILRP